MPRVFVPPLLRTLTGGNECVDIEGATLRDVVVALESAYPGLQAKLCNGDEIRPELSVSIDDAIVSTGLAEVVPPDCEIHFLPALGGG